MKFLVISQNAQEREELKSLLRQLDRRAQISDVRDWLQAERALANEERDLVLCDLTGPASRAEAVKLLGTHKTTLMLAGVSRNLCPEQIVELMHAGVKAVMPRELGARGMVRALELVLLGSQYVPPSALRLTPTRSSSQASEVAEHLLPYRRRALLDASLLSPRQQQIIRLVHMGSTNKAIARALGISEGTVKIHLATVFKTLGASNRAAAVAIYNGWLFDQIDDSTTRVAQGFSSEPPEPMASAPASISSTCPQLPAPAKLSALSDTPPQDPGDAS